MGLTTDIIVAVPIGFIYNVIIHRVSEMINENSSFDSKIQRNLVVLFLGGMLALVLAMTIFNNNKKLKNRSVRFGLYVGSFLLFMHTLLYNWDTLNNGTKVFIMASAMSLFVWYAYKNDDNENTKNDEENIENGTNKNVRKIINYNKKNR